MASLSNPAPQLDQCVPYCTTDPVLGPIIVFYSPQSSISTTRVEAHILTCAGFHSYPRLAVSQSSPLYAAVNHLPPHRQFSETHRGLAVAVLKYFSDLPKPVKETILKSKNNGAQAEEEQAVAFDEMHAGDLAARLKEVDSEPLAYDLECALAERFASALDLDIVLRSPDGDVSADTMPPEMESLLDLFGEPTHLPFAKLKRAPSRPAAAMVRPKSLADPSEALGRELEELRHTEENYLAKLLDLSENIAKPMKLSRAKKGESSSTPTVRDLDALFPPSLEQIIEVNTAFADSIETGGVEEVAKTCVKHFPNFRKPYEDYLRASAEFSQLLAKFTKNKDTSFSRRVQQTGEQKLRSLIIEPVQRLPRYSLLIDNMINFLSPDDPSLGPLNEARNMITEICSLQTSEKEERTTTTKRLQSLVLSWPPTLQPSGRLITAIDFFDVLPPYNNETSEAIPSILLLFPDCVVILRRPSKHSMLARGVMAEVDRPAGGSQYGGGSGNKRDTLGHDLQFAGWIDLSDVRLASSDRGTTLWMTLVSSLKDSWDVRAGGMGVRKMQLWNAYEGRASKVEEEFAKARLERRVVGSEKGIVGVREAKAEGLTFWSCVWGSESRYASKTTKGSTVIYLDVGDVPGRSGKELLSAVGKEGVDISVGVDMKDSRVRIECRSWNSYASTDTVAKEQVLSTFARRINSILRLHASPQHPPVTPALMSANRKLLRSVGIHFDGDGKSNKLRPPSPTKIFSSFRGNSDRPTTAPQTPQRSRQLVMDRSTHLAPTPGNSPERPSALHRGSTVLGLVEDEEDREAETIQRITMASTNPLRKLEDTFEAFIDAVKEVTKVEANIRSLHDLSGVDHDAAEVLLGLLVNTPNDGRVDPSTGANVVFVAFSRFLQQDWKDGMGSIIDQKSLEELQAKAETLYPIEFEEYFKTIMVEWTPQNKRAFKTIVLLLKELQDRVDADDDLKGVLTKAFAELLAGNGVNALDHMSLVDRLVADADMLFNESLPSMYPSEGSLVGPLNGSSKHSKSNSVTNASISSTSSIRRRFGLSHTNSARESKLDRQPSDERVKNQSVWRTLSKSSRESVKDSWKGHLGRSRSTDYDGRPGTSSYHLKRPSSGERPTVLGSDAFDSLTPAKQLRPLSTIIQSPHAGSFDKPLPVGPPGPGLRRAKRRSSISSLSELAKEGAYTPTTPAKPEPTPVPTPPPEQDMDPVKKMLDFEPRSRDRLSVSPRPLSVSPRPLSVSPRPLSVSPRPPSSVISDDSPQSGSPGSSLRRERRDIQGRKSLGSSGFGTPQRLKMPSQQKIRERLHHDHQAITQVEAGLLKEIDKIGEELNGALKPQRGGLHTSRYKELSSRLAEVEARAEEEANKVGRIQRESQAALRQKDEEMEALRKQMQDALATRDLELEALRKQSRSALDRKEQEMKEVDKLFNDCQEENDVMFEKFNEELGKISAALRKGSAETEVMEMLQQTRAEQGKLKRENMRLRRENASLRSQVDGMPGPPG